MLRIFVDEIPGASNGNLSISPSLAGLNPGLQSGHLLTSLKSHCVCCGQEIVDDADVPDELLTHGVQVRNSVKLCPFSLFKLFFENISPFSGQ